MFSVCFVVHINTSAKTRYTFQYNSKYSVENIYAIKNSKNSDGIFQILQNNLYVFVVLLDVVFSWLQLLVSGSRLDVFY